MLDPKSLAAIHEIQSAHESSLAEHETYVFNTADQLGRIEEEVTAADEALATAEEAARQARAGHMLVHEKLCAAQQGLREKQEGVTQEIADAVAAMSDPDVIARTFYYIAYRRSRTLEAAREVIGRGATAFQTIDLRLTPNQPVFYHDSVRNHFVAGYTPREGALAATPPEPSPDHDSQWTRASLELLIPNAVAGHLGKIIESSRNAYDDLILVREPALRLTLLDETSELQSLEDAAGNEDWLTIGEDAITARVEELLSPKTRLMALTTLSAAGIWIPVELGGEMLAKAREKLVGIVSFLAVQASQTDASPLSESVSLSIRATAQMIGLGPDELSKRTTPKLQKVRASRTEADPALLCNNLDRLVETIFA